MSEFKGTKEEKALVYAKDAWGPYFDDKHPDIAIEKTQGEITQTDYLEGYDQALIDCNYNEMLEMLKFIYAYGEKINFEKLLSEIETLIKKATEL